MSALIVVLVLVKRSRLEQIQQHLKPIAIFTFYVIIRSLVKRIEQSFEDTFFSEISRKKCFPF